MDQLTFSSIALDVLASCLRSQRDRCDALIQDVQESKLSDREARSQIRPIKSQAIFLRRLHEQKRNLMETLEAIEKGDVSPEQVQEHVGRIKAQL